MINLYECNMPSHNGDFMNNYPDKCPHCNYKFFKSSKYEDKLIKKSGFGVGYVCKECSHEWNPWNEKDDE